MTKPARRRARPLPVDPVYPTPERIERAMGGYSLSPTGQMRVLQAPLDRLHDRRVLHRDPDVNEMLYTAGKRFREDWYASGLCGVRAADYGRTFGGSSDPAWSMPPSHYAAHARSDWRAARASMSPDECTVVGCVVLDEVGLVEAGATVTRGMAGGGRCRDVALELLVDGLRSLARHYGIGG